MPALPKTVVGAVDKRKIKVFFADRSTIRYWNENRGPTDLRFFGGWYWYIETDGKVSESDHGPYRSESAAFRNAFMELSLVRLQESEVPANTHGSGSRNRLKPHKHVREKVPNIRQALRKARRHLPS